MQPRVIVFFRMDAILQELLGYDPVSVGDNPFRTSKLAPPFEGNAWETNVPKPLKVSTWD